MRAQFVLSEMGIGLRRNLMMTVAVVLVVGISLTLLAGALFARSQVNASKDYWYDKVEVSVFLCAEGDAAEPCNGRGVTEDQRQSILDEIHALPQVKTVFYESQAEAYQHFKEQFKDSPDLVNNTTADQLPESYRVKLKDPKKFAIIQSALEGKPGVNSVIDQRKLLNSLFKILNGIQLAALIVSGVLVVACILLVSIIIQVSAHGRRRETQIMRLVGASNLYIQLPFLLEGAVAGLAGGLLACGMLAAGKVGLIDHVLAENINSTKFLGWGEILSIMPVLVIVGVLISGIAAFATLAFSKALRV
ncbi:MAG: cell division transport system permease protein [Frankiales bacterium]|nr:cell division transport system permease protein [Frankiales bacterium]